MKNVTRLGAVGVLAITSVACTAIVGDIERPKELPVVGASVAKLSKAQDCDSLLSELKADALKKLDDWVDFMISQYVEYAPQDYGGELASDAPSKDNSVKPGGASREDTDSEDGASERRGASEYSSTNIQVDGVDEADIVKTDGKYIYVLRGQEFVVVRAFPASELAQRQSFGIEGNPIEMFVTDKGQVVVFSKVGGASVYEAAGVVPRSVYGDVRLDSATPDVGFAGDPSRCMPTPLLKVTVLAVETGNEPRVLKELYLEGSYTSSRRMDSIVRVISQGASFGPALDTWIDGDVVSWNQWRKDWENLRAKNAKIINDSTLQDWLPYSFERKNGSYEASLVRCDDVYLPTQGTSTYGMTQVTSLDLSAIDAAPTITSVVSAADTVYATADVMILAAEAWVSPYVRNLRSSQPSGSASVDSSWLTAASLRESDGVGSTRQAIKEFVSTSYTQLHWLDLGRRDTSLQYRASGMVPGSVLNQFSIDVYKGALRIATSDYRVNAPRDLADVNHVFVLRSEGQDLREVGSIRDLAPTEQIHAARFMGEKGYLVTYRQVDPLFALDLSDPTAPRVVGELKIPGFSQYMHPLDDGHLLTIGQDEGLALQIFDVTNPVKPRQLHKHVYTDWAFSEAQHNHKAFTYFASKKVLAFPVMAYDDASGTVSALEVFDVDIAAGFTKRGRIEHSRFFDGDEYRNRSYFYDHGLIKRGIFMDDFVYAVSDGGVTAHKLSDISTVEASIAFGGSAAGVCY